LSCHFRNERLLPQNERLEWVQQIDRRIAGQQAVNFTVRGVQVVVKTTDMQPLLEVFPADIGIQMRGPRDGQGIHTVLVLQQVGLHRAVLTTTATYDAVISAVRLSMLVAQLDEFPLTLVPINFTIFLEHIETASVAYAFVIEAQGCLGRTVAVRVLVTRHRLLV